MSELCDFGLIGLAVMGENLALNVESRGYRVAVFNRTVDKVDTFMQGRAAGKEFVGCHSIEELVQALERPRKVMLLVKAGAAVDAFIDQLIPLLDPGDVIIDGGNTHFTDTERRTKYVEEKGLLFIGTGVSGGEEGALKGPSMMPGGSPDAWPLVKPIFQAIAAKVGPQNDIPCCEWVGPRGAGHYVKMVHNGIEYALMQAYGEGFELLAEGRYELDLETVAHTWNHGAVIRSWLLELCEEAFITDGNDLDGVADHVGGGSTGSWTVAEAIEHEVPIPLIYTALAERFDSRTDRRFSRQLANHLRSGFGHHPIARTDEQD